MACKTHPDRESVAICMTCKEELCEECRQVGPDGKSYCAAHLPAEQPQPQPASAAAPPQPQPAPAAEPAAAQPEAAPAPAADVEMPPRGTPEAPTGTSGGNESPVLAALCYLCWILTPLSFAVPIIVMATDYKDSRYMRYHAYNGLFWGLALLLVGILLSLAIWVMNTAGIPYVIRMPLGMVRFALLPVALIFSILFAVKANNRQDVKIPGISDFATKQLG